MRRLLVMVCLAAVAAAVLVGWIQFTRQAEPYRAYEGDEQFVEIAPGMGPAAIGARLIEHGIVRDRVTWRIAIWQSQQATRLKAGEYRFDRPLTAAQVIDRIVAGDVYLRPITFPEGLTMRQMARIFEERGLGAAADFLTAASDPAAVAAIDPAARDLEGYLFPDTYTIPRRATAHDLVAQMVERFLAVWTTDLQEAARGLGYSTREIVTLASLVEKETAQADERTIVSSVYHNRLRIRMRLQCDPTVIYALERAGRYTGNLTRENLSFGSPYNTYRYAGLPPGPIASPGRAALDAAARPATTPYLYFVSRNDGSHAFAASLPDHNRNVRTFQVEYFRRARPNAGH